MASSIETGPSDSPADFEDRLRQYRPHIQVTNIETPQQRFPRHGDHANPQTATWRSNLAALSQRRNLLFTAQGADIYVWIPKGSSQLLGSQPEMIVHPVMNQPHASGYIDLSRPHTINNLIVDDLGVDEVLLLVTDSGNVTGYNVEAIFSAMGRCAKLQHRRPFDGAEVKPFFAENVGQSAWGLAAHKFARLIAVSANTGDITVFAFAMVEDAPGTDNLSTASEISGLDPGWGQSGQPWVLIEDDEQMMELKKKMPDHRTQNLRLTYAGHFENIPCVSFANFDLDPNGTWMVSTDIFNRVLVWKIWEAMGPIRSSSYGIQAHDQPERGWSVLPIDPRRVHQHRLKVDACGCRPQERNDDNRLTFDITGMVDHLTDWTPMVAPSCREPLPTHHILPNDIFSPECIIDTNPKRRASSSGAEVSSTEASPDKSANVSARVNLDRKSTRETEASDGSEKSQPPSLRVKRGIPDLVEEANEHLKSYPGLEGESHDVEALLNLQQRFPFHPHNPQFFPIVHFSEHDISLVPYPCDSAVQIVAEAPLSQSWPGRSQYGPIHEACDRMNMIKYVPELGIIIAASQKGRVAIITLTWQAEIGHSFRVDWILPFNSQNTDLDAPKVPLMGMAVSPMPGFEQPLDVPSIPRRFEPKEWLKFDHRLLNPEKDDDPSVPLSDSRSPHNFNLAKDNPGSHSAGQNDSDPDAPPSRSNPLNPNTDEADEDNDPFLTLPELHALASDIYQPHEEWHGWHPSRHYRLLLLFCDGLIMSYEFWHTWKN
ncbi:hypothetical protein MYU51_010149 [Penicillium brevicompactum]|uniref:uncharacterized protein n=1 Tax=Penicillium brevicompactum TaxID=5074 RepID=UPI00253FDB1D|nr:uncharacterized protein N7506_009512 [Penicillium brevicompactum]KAJ5326410.1 hypothetical protein N7506_009512 [Penicillium brevicompactum]